MNIARLSCLAFLSLALFGCDQTAKKTPPTTAIKAREPVIGLALGGGGVGKCWALAAGQVSAAG